MRILSTSAIALIAAAGFSGSALAADVLDREYDEKYAAPQGTTVDHSGFYIGGTIGMAYGDRTIRQDIRTQKDCLYEGDVDGAPEEDNTPDGVSCDDDADLFAFASEGDAFPPILGPQVYNDLLRLTNSDDWNALTFGGEISYLYHIPSSRFGFEPVLSAVFYADNETTYDIDGSGIIQPGGNVFGGIYGDVGDENSQFTHSGTAAFEREHDIDLILRGHYFVNQDFSIYAQGGASWAKAKFSTAHTTGYDVGGKAEGVFDGAINQDDTSLGYVIGGGFQYWIAPRVTFGVDYTYKHHEFDFDGGNSTDSAYKNGTQLYRYGVSDDISVDEDIHAIKAKLSIKLN